MTAQLSLTPGLHKERLNHIRASYEASKQGHAFIGHPSYDEQIAIIDALLAGMDSKPPKVMGYVSGRAMMRMLRGQSRFCSLYPEPKGEYCIEIYLNLPPPAPVAVPDGYVLVPLKPSKDMLSAAEDERGADWQYAVDIWDSMCRAAMQSFGNSEQLASPRYTLPPHIYRELVNQLRDTAVKYQGCQQLREQLSATLRTVIAPAAQEQQNAQQNIPENIPTRLIDAVNRLLDSDGSRGRYSAIKCFDALEEIERLLAAAPAAPEQKEGSA